MIACTAFHIVIGYNDYSESSDLSCHSIEDEGLSCDWFDVWISMDIT